MLKQAVQNRRRVILEYLMIVLGTLLAAGASKLLFDPAGLVTGGFSGLSIIIKKVTEPFVPGGVPLWISNLVLNLPLFPIAWKLRGFRFVKRTLCATVLFSLWLAIVPPIQFLEGNDLFLNSVFGGILMGVGLGLVFIAHATTGGTDMVAAILQHFVPHYSISQLMQVLDGVIVLIGAFVFGIPMTLYAILAIYLTSKVSEGLIEGLKFSKMALIISAHYDEIGKGIIENLDRGATALYGRGMYSNADKNIILCVVSKKEIVAVKDLVAGIDPHAFVVVSDVREVLGEGFVQYKQ